jgi:AcrR family transcriptional regulator
MVHSPSTGNAAREEIPVSEARQALLDKTIAYVAAHGLSDVSLRELAASVGTSHRMLIYHFGNREGLVAAIVESIEAQQRTALDALAARATDPHQLVRDQWAQLSDPALRPFVVLFFEVLALALHERPGTEGFVDQLTDPWIALATRIAADLDMATSPAELRLGVAVTRGLLVDLLASGDLEATTAALDRFLDMWDRTRLTADT